MPLTRAFRWAGMGSNHRPEDYESGTNRLSGPRGHNTPGQSVQGVYAVQQARAVRRSLMGNVMGNPAPRDRLRTGGLDT
jgi:hypothetical protein